MKAGLVVGTAGQRTEREFLSKSAPTLLALEFYDLLVTTVQLKDFPDYRAGLDVNDEGGHGCSIATRHSVSGSARRTSTPSARQRRPPFCSYVLQGRQERW